MYKVSGNLMSAYGSDIDAGPKKSGGPVRLFFFKKKLNIYDGTEIPERKKNRSMRERKKNFVNFYF